MKQTKIQSLIEAIVNVLSGMVIAFSISQLAAVLAPYIQEYLYSGFIWDVGFKANIIMTCVLTIVSVIRGFIWRRIFNHIHYEQNLRRKSGE